MAEFQGKSVLVTGAGRGIGRAIALAFSRAGASVGVADIDANTAETTADLIRQSGSRALAISGDIGKRSAMLAAIDQTKHAFGGIDVIVNNAMLLRKMPLMEVEEQIFDAMLAIGLKAILWSAQAAVTHMDKGGVIINICSPSADRGRANSSVYSAVKGGVAALTRQLAAELGSRNIRVVAVTPGSIPTEAARAGNTDPALYEERKRRTPLGRLGEPEDIADAVLFMASRRANFITGQALTVDGGLNIAE
jgi:NAD(P)-dependent dehydrogenase (short-subunit alcohol dehydrogenase family)